MGEQIVGKGISGVSKAVFLRVYDKWTEKIMSYKGRFTVRKRVESTFEWNQGLIF